VKVAVGPALLEAMGGRARGWVDVSYRALSGRKAISKQERPERARMTRLPDSLAIALWVVGSCWVLAIAAYAFGGSKELLLPLTVLGILTGIAEWVLRRKEK
jgi:hypothetical protein